MAEVDRRGFLRLLRRAEPADEGQAEESEATPKDPRVTELADLTSRLLADVDAQDEEALAEGTLITGPFDLAYMRVTAGHIVFSIETGFSTIVQTKDVRGLDTEPPVESTGYGMLIYGTVRAHHPADLEHITRSYSFRFREDSPLLTAIRTACDLPEPEEEPAGAEAGDAPAGDAAPEPSGEPRG
jgi:hypothetical protein